MSRYLTAPGRSRWPVVAWALLLGPGIVPLSAAPARAQADAAPDSAEVLERARELQREFEEFRGSRIPVSRGRTEGGCDERIGRICIWFGGEGEEDFPAEFREVKEARAALTDSLSAAFARLPHRWILGQWVHYLVERGDLDGGRRAAEACGIEESWWCAALLGYVLHTMRDHLAAEAAFEDALATMPDSIRRLWDGPRYVFGRDDERAFSSLPAAEQERRWGLFWRLSDPLFLFEGNDRRNDHLARWVVATNEREAASPMALEWDEDLEETLIRYGINIGYSRTHDPARAMRTMQDTRQVVGHHHPRSRGYLFPAEFLESPSDIPPESWITAPREARTWYAPPYAPDIQGLETQVGRFRRGERMLVVGGYRPTTPAEDGSGRVVPAWGSEGGVTGEAFAALFLVPEDGRDPVFVRGSEPEGVLTLETRPDRYVGGLEVVSLEAGRAWRARQGVVQESLPPGLVDASDLMILAEGAPAPQSLDEAVPHVRPGVRLRSGERFRVVWEVYGLRVQEPVRVTLGFDRGRPGFLTRVGEFLGVIEPDRPVDVTFDETGPDRLQTVFRSVELQLPALDPGAYTLHLRLELAGRSPVVKSRPILVTPG